MADLVLLGRVLHDFYDDAAVKILETAHKALKPDGRIAIIESLGSCQESPLVYRYFYVKLCSPMKCQTFWYNSCRFRFLLPDVGANGGLCDLHLLTVTGGQERTHKEMDRLLGRAGFKESQLYKLSSLPSVLLAKKSECLDPSS